MKISKKSKDEKKISPARRLAYQVLLRVERTQSYADLLLNSCLEKEPLSPADRHLAWELVLGVLRHRGRLDWTLGTLVHGSWDKIKLPVKTALRLGAYQLLYLQRVPAYAALDEAVELVAREEGGRARGLVNAVLRKLQQEGEPQPPPQTQDPLAYLEHYLSHPRWLDQRWRERYGTTETSALCQANNRPHPLTLAVNLNKISREKLAARLGVAAEKIEKGGWSPQALKVQGLAAIGEQEAYRQGLYWVQDEASQLIAYLVAPQPGEVILDACAGKGTKALQMALMMKDQGTVLALDPQERVKGQMQEAGKRLGVTILKPMTGTAQEAGKLLPQPVDKVLVDAPCSGLGTLRHHPEIKWRRKPEDFRRLSALQLEILNGAARVVKAGGILVYAVCTWEPEETREVMEHFLEQNPQWQKVSAKTTLPPAAAENMVDQEGFFLSFPHKHGTDGFFGARLQKIG